jgi:hypothetical protein
MASCRWPLVQGAHVSAAQGGVDVIDLLAEGHDLADVAARAVRDPFS